MTSCKPVSIMLSAEEYAWTLINTDIMLYGTAFIAITDDDIRIVHPPDLPIFRDNGDGTYTIEVKNGEAEE